MTILGTVILCVPEKKIIYVPPIVFSFIFFKMIWLHAGVFYCGAPVLAQELNKLCHEFNGKSTTKFEFHKEHF